MDLSYLLVFSLTLILIYRFLTKNYDYWEKQNLPSMKNPIAGFGNILPLITLRKSIFNFLNDVYTSTEASMIGFYFMQTPGLIVRDPELVKCVLRTNFSNFRINLTTLNEKQDPILSKHPFFTHNLNLWKDRRIRMSTDMSNKKLQYLFVIAQNVSLKFTEYLDRKIDTCGGFYECNLKKELVKYTGEFVANAAFRMEGQSFHDDPDRLSFAKIASELFQPTSMNGVKQSLLFYLPAIADIFGIKFMSDGANKYFSENIKMMLKQRKNSEENPIDLVEFCLNNVEEGDLETLTADLISFYFDSYETSSSVLSHFFYHVSLHPEIQENLRQHIITKLDGNPVTYKSLKEMNYLDQVLNESMRVSSPVAALMKVCTEGITLTGSDGLKCDVKPGFPVYIPLMNLHQDKKYWKNPEVFDPERFNPENQDSSVKVAFLPFGDGPRKCIGMQLGLMLTKLAATDILTRYSLERSAKTKIPLEIDPTTIVTYYKGGVWARFKKLES